MNIRPYTDQLRRSFPGAFKKMFDSRAGGCRVVQLGALFHEGKAQILPDSAALGDRWLEVQIWEGGRHRVSHGLATRDTAMTEQGPQFYQATTYPTDFATPAEMLSAISVGLSRSDHKL